MNIRPLAACVAATPAMSAVAFVRANEIYIGVLAPLSGPLAESGSKILDGVKLAVDELNQANGRDTYSIRSVDDQCDPRMAIGAAEALVDSNVTAVLGGYCSTATLATSNVFKDAGLPFIVTGADPAVLAPASSANVFMIQGDEIAMAIEVMRIKGDTTLAVVSDEYGQNLATLAAASFKSDGGNVIGSATVKVDQRDYSSEVQTIAGAKPHAVLLIGNDQDSVARLTGLHNAGYDGQTYLLGSSGSTDLYASM
jgi:branched-chain amino acid transport system substrate-binding protein